MILQFEKTKEKNMQQQELFRKGEFGMLIAPSPTDAFAITLAMSACNSDTYQIPNVLTPKFKCGIYIDTVSEMSQLRAERKTAESRNRIGANKTMSTMIGSSEQTAINYSKCKTFTARCHHDIASALTMPIYNKYSSCFFVMLDTMLHRPKAFNTKQRKEFIDLVKKHKTKESTVILISRHSVSHKADFGVPLDFLINLTHDLDYFDLNKYSIKIQR